MTEMPSFTRIASKAELPDEGEAREFNLGEKMICIANVNGKITAMDNVCLHRGGPLVQRVTEVDKIVSPCDGVDDVAKTRQVAHHRSSQLRTFPTKGRRL